MAKKHKDLVIDMTDILFENDHILMKSEYRVPDLHSHLASHLVIGAGGSLHIMVNGQEFTADAVIIASDIVHTIYMDQGDMIVYLFDTASDHSRQLSEKYLKGVDFYIPEKLLTDTMREVWKESANDLKTADKRLLEVLGIVRRESKMDERITDVLTFLREMDSVPEDITDILCRRVCLSKSRLSHLFKEQMGISLHRYLALDKMKKGYLSFLEYGNITDAAMRAGFDSPSHFAATCKRMFGISFTEFIQSKR